MLRPPKPVLVTFRISQPGQANRRKELNSSGTVDGRSALKARMGVSSSPRFVILISMDLTMPKSTSKRGVFPSTCTYVNFIGGSVLCSTHSTLIVNKIGLHPLPPSSMPAAAAWAIDFHNR